MARIVYITNGMASTLNSGLELGRRLTDAGHQVTWLCDSQTLPQVTERGFEAHAIDADKQFLRDAMEANARYPRRRRHLKQFLQWIQYRRKIRSGSIANPEIETKVRELNPDLLLIDYEMHFAIISTAGLGIPTLLPIVWFSVFHDPALPPMHLDRPPPDRLSQRLSNRLAWSRLILGRYLGNLSDRIGFRAIRNALRPVGYKTNRRADLLKVARQKGFEIRTETSLRQWIKPHAYQHIPVLCFNVQEMEFPHQPHPNMRYVGPMIDRERPDRMISPESIRRWRNWLSNRPGNGTSHPLIYCSLGTFWSTDRTLLDGVIDVFRKRPDWQLVIGLGGKAGHAMFHDVPDNVLILDYAPQLEVIARADAAITHGGITSINEFVAFGVPMLVYSTGHVDQNGCAARVRYHGLGLVADRNESVTTAIESGLSTLLSNPAIRNRVNEMRKTFEEYHTRGQAVRVVEDMLRPGGGRSASRNND